jgi:RimJ/RimL family protein N-acetyltransferase
VAFEYQPTLRGPLIDLRPLHPSDFEALFTVAGDPLIWEQHPDKARSTPQGFRRFFDEAIASGGALLATKAGTGEAIGSSRFHGYSAEAREVEIGWTFLGRRYWGGNYNHELKRLMLEHAFQFVDRVVFIVGSQNFRSQRAVLKLGAIQTASRPDASGTQSLAYCLTPAAWARAVGG